MSVVQKAPLASLEIENRWDDAHAARLSPAELLLYRSNLLGSDKRITNFGGGNTSAKLKEKDPLTGAEVEVLWVKGSGGDLGTMKLDGFSTLVHGEVSRAGEVLRRSERRGQGPRQRAGAAVRALRLQPEPARRQHRHAAARTHRPGPRRSHASGRAHRHRRLGGFAGADRGDLRRRNRLVALDPPGLRARPEVARAHAEESEAQGRGTRGAWPVHLGRQLPGLLREHARYHQSRHAVVDGARARQAALRRRGDAGAHHRPAPRNRRRPDARDSRPDFQRAGRRHAHVQGRPLRRQRNRAGFRGWRKTRRSRGARHFLSRPLPAHQDLAAGAALRSGARGTRRTHRARQARDRGLPRALRRLLRSLQAARFAEDARRQSGGLPGTRRRHAHIRGGQGHGAHRRRVLRQRHQCHARRGQRFHLSRPAGAGSLRHRILGSRRSQAAAHAEAQGPGRAAWR